MDPRFAFAYWNLGLALAQQGKLPQAVAALEAAHHFSAGGLTMKAHLGYVYGLAGEREKAQQILDELQKAAPTRYVSSYYPALVHLGLGAHEPMFACLARAFQERCGFLAFLKVEPIFDPVRDLPPLADLQWSIDLAH